MAKGALAARAEALGLVVLLAAESKAREGALAEVWAARVPQAEKGAVRALALVVSAVSAGKAAKDHPGPENTDQGEAPGDRGSHLRRVAPAGL